MSEHEAAPSAAAGQDSRNLLMRIAAAFVLAPLAIGAAYAGGWWWAMLVTLAAIGLFVEWLMMTCAERNVAVTVSGIVALALAAPFLAVGRVEAALVVLGLGLIAVRVARLAAAHLGHRWISLRRRGAGRLRRGAARPDAGLFRVDLVLLVVWVTDIGGYFAGRGIGGPKLWPRVSPKKTWAGAIGGFAASLAVAIGFSALGHGKAWPLLVLAAALSIAAQFGDLFESAVKRRFGVKDSSHIIPGHGGIMDRLDGFVAAIVLAAIFGSLRGGVDSVGRALMIW